MMIFRQSTSDDVDAMAQVEADSWPEPLAASREAVATRVSVFAAGQWVAVREGQIVGTASAQRVHPDLLTGEGLTYERVTDNGTYRHTHSPDGTVYQLVGVGVPRAGQGFGAGRQLIDRQIEYARGLDGIERIVGFTRPARFHRFPNLSINEYVERRSRSGRVADPVLSFHLDSGARLVSIHADFRPEDWEARGYGILIEYPV